MQDTPHRIEHSDPVDQTQAEQPEIAVKPQSTLRWFWRGGVVVLLLLMGLIGFVMTGQGQRTLLTWAAKNVEGLSLETVEGSIQEGLSLKNTAYRLDGVEVQVGQADLHIDFHCLLAKKACVENIALKDATIQVDTAKLPPSSEKKSNNDTTSFNLPLEVALKTLVLDNVNVRVDEMDIQLNHFHSGIQGKQNVIAVSPTLLDGLHLSLAPEAVENTKGVAKNKAKNTVKSTDWTALKKQLSQPLLNKLAPISLPFYLELPDFQAKNIRIEQKQPTQNGRKLAPTSLVQVTFAQIQGKSSEQKIELMKIDLQTDKGNVNGQGELTMAGNYPLKWTLHGSHPELKALKIPASYADVNIHGELFGKTHLSAQSRGAAKFTLNGTVGLTEAKTPFQLSLKSDQITYPFMPEKGSDPLNIKQIDLNLNGNLLDYRLKARFNHSGMALPAGNLQVDGKGEITHFALNELILTALGGKLHLNGQVDWTDGVAWDSALKLNNINTQSLVPEWAAILTGELHSKGYALRGADGKAWGATVQGMDVNGTLFQKKLQLKGDLTADSQTLLNVQQAKLIYGENVIALNGILGEHSDFTAQINAPNLKGLVPKLSAAMKGNVKLQGNITEPSLDLDLVANDVAYEGIELKGLNAKGKITTDKQIVADLDVTLNQFSHGDINIANANLLLKGNEAKHSLKLTSKGDPVGANLQITGQFDTKNQIWQGQLSNVAIQTPLGLLQNDKTVQVSFHNKTVMATISAHCWRHSKMQLCFPQAFQAGQEGQVPFEIRRFDLAGLRDYLDKNTQLTGLVEAKGNAAWFKQKSPQVNLELTSNSVKFQQKLELGAFPLVLSPVKITAQLADNSLNVKTDVRIENNGRLTGEMLMRDLANKRPLSGNINIDKLNLSLLKPLLSAGESLNGEINARLTLGGNVDAPLLFGNLNLSGLRAKSNAMPFDVTGGGLTMRFNGANSTLKGSVQTPQSQLLLDGDANWQKLEAWYTRIRANANKFRLDVPGMAKVDVSPNIEVKVTPKELVLGGKVDIPWARIEVQELPESAVSISGDEVIMTNKAKSKRTLKFPLNNKNAPQNGQGMAIKGDVTINIGKDVNLEAYGLKTNLHGTIKVRQGNKGLGLYGQVNLTEGTFASFGQDLIIRKGVISFTGLPSQPTLDIEAIRNPEAMEDSTITAGVKVTGIADALDVQVFSHPVMSQNEALSYILTGRGMESGGDTSSDHSIAAALIGLSLSKSGKTVGKVGSAFGINDLNVTTAGIGDNTKVVVSGSLTPRFKVKYGVGLFAPLTELTLRYRLAPSLYLQWVSSLNQAVDLLYRFEF